MRLEIPLLVEAAAADGAAVGLLPCVDQLVPLQLVGVGELFPAHRAVIFNLLFGLFQEFRRDFQRNTKHLSAGTLFPCVGAEAVREHGWPLKEGTGKASPNK